MRHDILGVGVYFVGPLLLIWFDFNSSTKVPAGRWCNFRNEKKNKKFHSKSKFSIYLKQDNNINPSSSFIYNRFHMVRGNFCLLNGNIPTEFSCVVTMVMGYVQDLHLVGICFVPVAIVKTIVTADCLTYHFTQINFQDFVIKKWGKRHRSHTVARIGCTRVSSGLFTTLTTVD